VAPGEEQDDDLSGLLRVRGIFDLESGLAAAQAYFRAAQIESLAVLKEPRALTPFSMGLLAMMTRAQSFHEGGLAMIRADNPYAADALIRAYAENAAALLWLSKHPKDIGKFSFLSDGSYPVPVGRMVDHAVRDAPGFKKLYSRLSESAHPTSATFPTSWRAEGDDGSATWSSVPAYKVPENRLWACLWLMEITDIHLVTWPQLYRVAAPRVMSS